MNIAVIGTGYVGLVSGACFAELGHRVVCVDKVESKIRMLLDGEVPIYEPGLKELLAGNREAGRIGFTTDLAGPVRDADIVIADWRDRLRDQWHPARGRLGPAYDSMLDLPAVLAGGGRVRPHGGRGVFLSDGRSLEDLAAVSLLLEDRRA